MATGRVEHLMGGTEDDLRSPVVVEVEEGHGAGRSGAPRDAARILARVDPPLRPPPLVEGLVDRSALLRDLDHPTARVAIVSAPAGYGKTTLLAQWAAASARPVNWVSITESDNDAPALLAHLLLALEATTTVLPSHYQAIPLSAAGSGAVVLPRVGALVADAPSCVWIFDDVHVLTSDPARQILRVFVDHLGTGSSVVLAGRCIPDLPVARWRADRMLVELGVDDLTLSDDESLALLRGAGADLAGGTAAQLVSRTEGWPAGLYLSTLALRERVVGVDVVSRELDDRAVGEYLFEEVVRLATDDEASFLVQSAVLDHITPGLCDAILERSDSATVLDRLERSNRFVRSVGPQRNAYRYHQLFRDLLRHELQRRDPGRDATLHQRASVWWEAHGDIDRAVTHARDAGDGARVAQLVFDALPLYVGSGRDATVRRWIAGAPPEVIAASPALLVAAAWAAFTGNDVVETERWTAVLHGHPPDERLPDGATVGAATALLDALVSRGGLGQSLADAARAAAEYTETSPYRSLACLIAGMAAHHLGDPSAREWLEESRRLAVLLPPTAAQADAQLAALATDEGRWADAVRMVDDALEIVERYGFHERPAMCQVYAIASLVHAHEGRRDAKDLAKHGAWLVGFLCGVARFAGIHTRIVLVRALVTLGEHERARDALVEARALLDSYPDAGRLPGLLDDAARRLNAAELPLGVAASPLTPAELRVLQYLPTHLSFAEIADEIFVSRNTVKTQAIAVYRKLGVTSRTAAVDRARASGLLDG